MKRFWKRSRQLQQCRSFVYVQPVSGPERSNFRLNAVGVCASTGEKGCQPACQRRMHAQLLGNDSNNQQERRDLKRYKYKRVICILSILTHCIRLPIQLSCIFYNQINSLSFFRKSFKETEPLFDQLTVTHPQRFELPTPESSTRIHPSLPPRVHTAKQGKGGIDAIFCATLND